MPVAMSPSTCGQSVAGVGTPRLVLGVRGKLGEIAEELLLRLGRVLLALRQRAIVAQLLDLVLEAFALGLQRRLVGARNEAALRVDG